MIYNVAIVDDEVSVAQQLESWVGEYAAASGAEFSVHKFCGSDEFLLGGFKEYDIIFMDINMPDDQNGLAAAKKVRAAGSKAAIIFCTNYAQYAINGYEVGALNYLIKPVEKAVFMETMTRAVRMLKRKSAYKMMVKTVDGQELIPVDDILYVEVMVHNLYFYINADGGVKTVRTRGSLGEVAAKLANMNFARCSSCYLVNLAQVTSVNKKSVQLSCGQTLAVSRKFVKDFMNSFMRYLSEFGIIDG